MIYFVFNKLMIYWYETKKIELVCYIKKLLWYFKILHYGRQSLIKFIEL